MNSLNITKYEEKHDKVTLLVNEFDPCGFIHFGAPHNEYDCLTNKILNYYLEKKTRDEIKIMIIHEVEYHFGCIDLSVMLKEDEDNFLKDLDNLLNKLETEIIQ